MMDYKISDLENIARLLSGLGSIDLPESVKINEMALYECCYDMRLDTSVLDNSDYELNVFIQFMQQLADADKLILFINYYFNSYIESHIEDLTAAGYSVFQLKDRILTSLNALWSISQQEFGMENSKITLKTVKFKEYDKMGEGGFCTVYRCPTDNSRVYKVLNNIEKADVSSVHRFKREFEIMNGQNDSGFTIKVFDYDSTMLVYSMERASRSLEAFINTTFLSDSDKDAIVIRCAECMKYLHGQRIIHRDFHPGNILQIKSGQWVVTDFGLAKDISNRYSHQTTTTNAVGRAWFTDPVQLVALKEGNYRTDMFSLAKTIDYIMDGNLTGAPHKFSSVVYKATASDPDSRYDSIDEMYEDLISICERADYKSPEEIVRELLVKFKTNGRLDVVRIINLLNNDPDGTLMWNLVVGLGSEMSSPFAQIINISFEVALREIRRISTAMQGQYHNWKDYDIVAYWAIGVINTRKNRNDDINIEAANIVEYVASIVGRYDIMRASNGLKSDSMIDGHVRAQLTYHEGY